VRWVKHWPDGTSTSLYQERDVLSTSGHVTTEDRQFFVNCAEVGLNAAAAEVAAFEKKIMAGF
jgi:hypothetical protein